MRFSQPICLSVLCIIASLSSLAQKDTSNLKNIISYYRIVKDTSASKIDSLQSKTIGKLVTTTDKADSLVESISSVPVLQLNTVQQKVKKYDKKIDSSITALQEIPSKYIKQIDKKIDKYSSRLTSKTEKTLTKLSKWENKIKRMLDKTSPETSAKLFAANQVTFTSLLQKLKDGENIATTTRTKYDAYRDKLSSSLKYVQSQKDNLDSAFIKPAGKVFSKMNELDQDVANTEAVATIIKERKKQLINESIKYIGKSKYLTKINKESYYYVETLKNYKEIFSDQKKAEETALNIINRIPAFKKYAQQNGQLASLFGSNAGSVDMQSLAGLQTRSGVSNIIQNRISAGGPNAASLMQANMNLAKKYITELKEKVLKVGGSNSSDEIPDFKPNEQKTKTFFQRLEYGANLQSQKAGRYFPVTTDISVSVAYKFNDKSSFGIGASYKIGLGKGFDDIRLSSQGIGLRSFMDWKIKKSYFITGGYEQNYRTAFSNIEFLKNVNNWQQRGLIGLSKKYKINKKMKGNIQFLYDFLSKSHLPVSQPFVYRIGYTF